MKTLKTLAFSLLVILSSTSYAQGRIERLREAYDSLGNTKGVCLFPKEKGANLRILDMNVWEWDGTREKLPKAWMEIGEDCTNEVRSVGFGCIDHFFIYDPSGNVEVKTFIRDYAWFTVKLTDHYPNYADIKL